MTLGSIATLLLVLPSLASAKGSGLDHVTLDGPGIGKPINVEKHYPYLLDDAIVMHVFGSTRSKHIGRDQPNRTGLGPRFQLGYVMTFGEPVEIDFYPYADKGPVAYASPGQSVVVPIGRSGEESEFPLRAGWYDYKGAIVGLLQDDGLPTREALDAGAAPWVLWTGVLATSFVACGLLRRRQDRIGLMLRPSIVARRSSLGT